MASYYGWLPQAADQTFGFPVGREELLGAVAVGDAFEERVGVAEVLVERDEGAPSVIAT